MASYIGLFLIAFSSLALEITLSRILNVTTWYHLAFFAISTALLGLTAGATTVYLRPQWFQRERLAERAAAACLGFALTVPCSLVLLMMIPVNMEPTIMSLFSLLAITILCLLPFYFSGIAISLLVTKSPLPIGRLYASDLLGSSLGSLFVLAGLEIFDAPSLVLLCAAIGGLAGLVFTWGRSFAGLRRYTGIAVIIITFGALLNSTTMAGIRPVAVRGRFESPALYEKEDWNSFSRVAVYHELVGVPSYWGPSPLAPKDAVAHYYPMNIDGDAGTVLQRFQSTEDIAHLRYDVTGVVYNLRPTGGAAIIGSGGGRDVQTALLFGQERVVGIELNPIFVNLLTNEYRDYAGLADHAGVTLVSDEGRSYLSRTDETFSVIQMSLVDTFSSTAAGAFSLSENAVYTVEAWQVFLSKLKDDGIFTVSRWYAPHGPVEAGRTVSLGVASLLRSGVTDPSKQIAMIASDKVSTLLVSKRPFTSEDLEKLQAVAKEMQFDVVIMPGAPSRLAVFDKIVNARSESELQAAVADQNLNFAPPTDESPYFFNLLLLNHIGAILDENLPTSRGNLIATYTLMGLIASLTILTLLTIILPLYFKTRTEKSQQNTRRSILPGAIYFSLIGAGFMLVEIALIQRLSVFLSHPVYALGILLFTMIASTGVGSFLSDRLPLSRGPWMYIYPVVTVLAILALRFLLPGVISSMITAPIPTKILISVAIIFPVGILLGLFFPTGMKLARQLSDADTPWFWALNGVFGVLCSAVAVFVSIYVGVTFNFYLAAACYAAVLVALYLMRSVKQSAQTDYIPTTATSVS